MRTLRDLREAVGLTQLEVAMRLGVVPGTVFNWERGRGEPRASQIQPLARILSVSTDELLAALATSEAATEKVAA